MRRLGRKVVAALAGTSAVTLGVTVAVAVGPDNIVPTDTYNVYCENATQTSPKYVCQTDNSEIFAFRDDTLSNVSRTAVAQALLDSYDNTQLSAQFTSTPVYSGTGETDIIYKQGTFAFTGSVIGIAWCDDAIDNTYRCDQQYVKFRYNATRALACHETGHAVGLLHGNSATPFTSNTDPVMGCMRTPVDPDVPFLGSNNVTNIKLVY